MKRYTLIVADSSEDFGRALQLQFESFCTVHCCTDGREALDLLGRLHADVLVLDLMLPQMDGLSLLNALSATGDCPGILATSAYVSPYIQDAAEKLGVACLLEKPCELQKAEEAVRELLKRRERSCPEDRFMRISGLLLHLGFSAKLRGYAYLRDAVLKFSEDPGLSIIKELYPCVAGIYGVTAEDVEHSIRSAAMDAWAHSLQGVWSLYFPQKPGTNGIRPSNAALIQGLARSLTDVREPAALQML